MGNSGDDLRKNLDNHPSYDDEEDVDDGGLNAGSQRKGTIYLIGVRQSGEDKTSNGKLRSKIALPFEILERQGFDANSGDNEDAKKSKDVWTEEAEEQNSARKPISLSKEAVIKVSEITVNFFVLYTALLYREGAQALNSRIWIPLNRVSGAFIWFLFF